MHDSQVDFAHHLSGGGGGTAELFLHSSSELKMEEQFELSVEKSLDAYFK